MEGPRGNRRIERRQPTGAGTAFADWVIFGNIMMLCEGLDVTQALERCEQLGDALAAPAG